MPRTFQFRGGMTDLPQFHDLSLSQIEIIRSSEMHRRSMLLPQAFIKYDTTFPGYNNSQYAREALEYMTNEQLEAYIDYEYFSFSFVYCIIYLEALSLDSEFLSAFCIAEKAFAVEEKIVKDMELISTMRNEHYRKYGTFFEKIKSYLKLN